MQSGINCPKTVQTNNAYYRARLKQRLEASHEGVSTEDGSSSVTSGLEEDHALQADIMMRRLVKVRAHMHARTCMQADMY